MGRGLLGRLSDWSRGEKRQEDGGLGLDVV